jgi:hypothetical protein
MMGKAVMRVRLQRQGSEWVDAGSSYSLIALDEEAPYEDPGFCHNSVTMGGVSRTFGPLIVNNGDAARLEDCGSTDTFQHGTVTTFSGSRLEGRIWLLP